MAPRVTPTFMLLRVAIRPEGAFGVLLAHGLPFAVTLERTYDAEGGKLQFVKIPTGVWRCIKSFFHKGGYDTYEILVPGYSRLLFHKGNVEAHSDGCVLVGESFAGLGIAESGAGLAELLSRAGGRTEFELVVRA